MEFELKIESSNAAFDYNTAQEVARILREDVIPKLESGYLRASMRDINGNRVGAWFLDIDEPEESADDES